MSKLIGTSPNQVPSNADLGTMAYQNIEGLTLANEWVTRMWAVETTTAFSTTSTTTVTDVFGSGITLITRPNTRFLVTATFSTMKFADGNARAGLRIKSNTSYYEVSRDAGYTLGDIRLPFTVSKIFDQWIGGQTITFNAGFISIDGGQCQVNGHPGGTSVLSVFEIERSGS